MLEISQEAEPGYVNTTNLTAIVLIVVARRSTWFGRHHSHSFTHTFLLSLSLSLAHTQILF